MKKKKRVLIASVLSIVLCLALLVGSTYALYTDSAKVQNHLQAGVLDMTLTRTNLKWNNLDKDGFLSEGENKEVVNFTDTTTAERNVFDFNENTVLVPQAWCEATMNIENNGDVAFSYWIEVVLTGENNDFAKQLQLTVTTSSGSQTIGNGITSLGSKSKPLGVIKKGAEAEEFSIKVTFADRDDNDLAQGQKATFDLIVHAVQATSLSIGN